MYSEVGSFFVVKSSLLKNEVRYLESNSGAGLHDDINWQKNYSTQCKSRST